MEREKIKNDLLNADFPDVQSETLSYLFAQMATKDDLRRLETKMDAQFREVRSEFRAELRGEFRSVRSEMQAMKSELLAVIDKSAAEVRQEVAEAGKRTAESIADLKDRLLTVALGIVGAMTAVFTALELFFR